MSKMPSLAKRQSVVSPCLSDSNSQGFYFQPVVVAADGLGIKLESGKCLRSAAVLPISGFFA
jgi:hypothetical protein